MHRYASLFFIFLLFTFSPQGQENKTKQDYQLLYRDAEKLYKATVPSEVSDRKAMTAYLQVAGILTRNKIYNDTLVDCYLKCGILLMSKNETEQALRYFHRAIGVASENDHLQDTVLFKPYLYAGSTQYELNNLDSAVYYYKKAESILAGHSGLSESERLFNKFGALYFETGDYNKSISYFEKALSIVKEKTPTNVFFIINYKNNIATALMKLGRYDQALEIFKELLVYPNPGDEILFNMGNTYFEKSAYEEALKYLSQVRHMGFEKLSSLTKIFIRLHQYDSAQYYLTEAGRLYHLNNKMPSRVTYGIIQKYAGDLKVATGKPQEALEDYQRAIISLDPSFEDENIMANPSSFYGLQNFLFLFDALVAKANALKSFSGNDIKLLEQSIHAYESALTLAKHIEKTYFSDDARLFLKNKVNPATRDAVETAIQLYHDTKDAHFRNLAFSFVENNKASVLQAGLKNLELSSIPGLPAGLLAEEKKYRTMLAKLGIEAASKQNTVLTLHDLETKIHDIEVGLASVQDKLDENPVYHNLKFSGISADMESLQNSLKSKDEAILSYYYTDSNLICFYITNESAGFSYEPLQGDLFSTIISLRRELEDPAASGRKYLREAGSTLFNKLIASVFDKIKDKKRLIIIPFNEISYVPFEMLVNTADGSLLVSKFSISYDYSANFLSDKKEDYGVQYQVFAMAPFSGGAGVDLILPVLPGTVEEIKELPGKKLSGPEATKKQFEIFSGEFPIIHLATHAVANDTNLLGSYIEFYGLKNEADTLHRLYEQEIYTLDLHSVRLVILSACETGNGLLVNGEGVMSLSRAFSYAGCKTVITSLWKADEISTTFISKRFHHYLQNGFAIDEALQQAKMDYLKSSEVDDRYKNPAYWAHLVLIGDYHRVVKPGMNRYLWLGAIAALGLLVFLLIKKQTRHKNIPGSVS